MVLESILSPQEAEKNPIDMMFLGFGAVSISLWLSYYIFPQGTSMWVLFMTALAIIPLLENVLAIEEAMDEIPDKVSHLFQRHSHVIWVYFFLFIGMMLAFSFWYVLTPSALTKIIFSSQIKLMAVDILPSTIFVTNIKLLGLFILLSLIFGSGAILLLTWNAAFTGVIIGSAIKQSLAGTITLGFFAALSSEIFSILGYSAGAIAGGILSVAFIRKHYKTKYFHTILKDVALMSAVSVAFVAIGALMAIHLYVGGA